MSVAAIDAENQPRPADETSAGGKLLLDSLEITNFRAFKHLVIPKLGTVNLITGKNNVGKTTLLEAILLYSEKGSPRVVRDLLKRRKDLWIEGREDLTAEDLMFHYMTLFHMVQGYESGLTTIGPQSDSSRQVGVLIDETQFRLFYGNKIVGRGALDTAHYDPALLLPADTRPLIIPCIFLSTGGWDAKYQAELWPQVVAQGAKEEVEQLFRRLVVDFDHFNYSPPAYLPRNLSERIHGTGTGQYSEDPAGFTNTWEVWLENKIEPMPMESLGEGARRFFGLLLCLYNARDGFLLIDEAENGFHYSIMTEVWQVIFELAMRLNVQVFATTHSWDCIAAFQKAAAEDDDPGSGVLVRLERKGEDIVSTVFDERRLAYVTSDGIEVR